MKALVKVAQGPGLELTERVITARRDGWAVSEEEIDTGVWAASLLSAWRRSHGA